MTSTQSANTDEKIEKDWLSCNKLLQRLLPYLLVSPILLLPYNNGVPLTHAKQNIW